MPEIVLITGYNAAGKTTVAHQFPSDYIRINRDEIGGKTADMLPTIKHEIANGHSVICDGTFPTIPSRQPFIDLAKELGVEIKCVHLDTSFEDAQLNACLRQISLTGGLVMPDDFKKANNPNLFPPAAIFRYKKLFENKKSKGECPIPDYPGKQYPDLNHGFDSVVFKPFKRIWPDGFKNKALILDADDTIRRSTGKEAWPLDPSEVEIIDGVAEIIQKYVDEGYLLLGVSNQSTHEKKGYETPLETIDACFEKTNELLGHNIEWHYCPHYRFPVQCYCRKPHSGLGAVLIMKHKLRPSKCVMVGDSTSDKTFATRCGFRFIHAKEFGNEQ